MIIIDCIMENLVTNLRFGISPSNITRQRAKEKDYILITMKGHLTRAIMVIHYTLMRIEYVMARLTKWYQNILDFLAGIIIFLARGHSIIRS